MKTWWTLVLALFFAVSVSACAPMTAERQQVKCPACGYEFTSPLGG